MTAESVPEVTVPEPEPTSRWPMPPLDGWTVDDLHTLPGLPPHTEMIDGSLVFVGPQRCFHSMVIDLLVSGLRLTTPSRLKVRREMTVVIDRKNGPEPDVSVLRAEAVTSRSQTFFHASDVVLAVEVVSPESRSRDRDTKPRKYAAAGIEHFWLVEMVGEEERPVVYVYERDPVTETYTVTGIHHDRLKLSVPFDIDIDLTEIDTL
ncbi:Uma2 family endonuclease [Streptomyces nodosus]|uniref:Uma2 family endonuclease n=1 Tax=Streptomyces nodosus TaxID=40318 RepID=UPI0036E074E8